MPDDIAIAVENVSKAYRIWESPASRLTSPLQSALARLLPRHSRGADFFSGRAARGHRDFHALQDVSFTVKRGESVGIIGRNGSGKSTLLQIIAGTLQPSSGHVRVNGRVAALLELGSGFNPEFTGRENVFLNGTVLGLTRRQITAIFDEIADFADIGDFIDQPIKTYSSGMVMRLAFSVQTAVKPDILIVDEALAVGDAQFVAKCINRIASFIRNGGTMIFVSHEVGLVKQLTTKALFLQSGHQMAFGLSPETVLSYSSSLAAAPKSQAGDPDCYVSAEAPYGIRRATLAHDGDSAAPDSFAMSRAVQIKVVLDARNPAPAQLVFSIYNYMGIIVCSNTVDLPAKSAGRATLVVDFALPKCRLAPGSYRVNFAVRTGIDIVAWARNALVFKVTGTTTETFIYREDVEATFSFVDGNE